MNGSLVGIAFESSNSMTKLFGIRATIVSLLPVGFTLRKRFLSLLIFCMLALLFYRASDAASVCELQEDGSELCTIMIHDNDRSEATRSYRYEIRRAVGEAPTVVLLPGGPGQSSIGDIHTLAAVELIPENFGVIAIDPRGVGKNDFGPDLTNSLYSSAQVAMDVIEVLRHENLNHYLIYGESYGTVVATHLAHQLNDPAALGLRAGPESIVLSRVIGRAFGDQLADYNAQLARVLKDFSAAERAQIQTALSTLQRDQYQGNSTAFGAALMQALLLNVEAARPGPLSQAPNFKTFLHKLAQQQDFSRDPVYNMLAHAYSSYAREFQKPHSGPRNHSMAEIVKCSELSDIGEEARIEFELKNLTLNLKESDCKAKGYTLSRPYEPAALQIAGVPILYLQGDIDPVTDLSAALNHFEAQQTKNKTLVVMRGFAHTGFLGLWNCRQGLWESFVSGPQAVRNHIGLCADPQVQVLQ